MTPGLQTHIEAPVPLERLAEVARLGYRIGRVSAMDCPVELMLQNVRDLQQVGMTPLVTIADPDRLRLFQRGDHVDVECRNEDDGDLDPEEYRRILDEMAARALETGIRLWGGVGSNTDEDTLRWGVEVRDCGRGWPPGMYGLSWHTYGPYPHHGFRRRPHQHPALGELGWLLAMAGDLPVLISEFGYPNTTGTTAFQQAEAIGALWDLFTECALWGACLFQMHDGPDPTNREHRYGIFACDETGHIGALKPVAYTLPKEETITMIGATLALSRRAALPHPDRPGYFLSPHEGGVLSVQPDGSIQTRPVGTTGPYETWHPEGNRAVFEDVAGHTFALPLVD